MTQPTAGTSFESDISGATISASVSDSEPMYGCGRRLSLHPPYATAEADVSVEHLEELSDRTQKQFCDLVQNYAKLYRKGAREEPWLSLSFHCLQCSQISPAKDRDIHAKDTGHLYCKHPHYLLLDYRLTAHKLRSLRPWHYSATAAMISSTTPQWRAFEHMPPVGFQQMGSERVWVSRVTGLF